MEQKNVYQRVSCLQACYNHGIIELNKTDVMTAAGYATVKSKITETGNQIVKMLFYSCDMERTEILSGFRPVFHARAAHSNFAPAFLIKSKHS